MTSGSDIIINLIHRPLKSTIYNFNSTTHPLVTVRQIFRLDLSQKFRLGPCSLLDTLVKQAGSEQNVYFNL